MQKRLAKPHEADVNAARRPTVAAPRPSPSLDRLSPAMLAHVQRFAGNRAAASLIVQRHAMAAPAEALDELEEVSVQRAVTVQRVLSDQQMRTANNKVKAAIDAATSVRKTVNPILYNAGKALKNRASGITWSVRNTDDADDKASVAGAQPTHINIGGTWVIAAQPREVQGALAHEVSHVLSTGTGIGLAEDEFNAYISEVTANTGGALPTPTQMVTKLAAIHRVLTRYGFWGTLSAAEQLKWQQETQAQGFNLSKSWKQKKLLDMMRDKSPVADVLAFIKKMNEIDRNEAREARKPDGAFYLAYGNYSADAARIWRALGGAAGAGP